VWEKENPTSTTSTSNGNNKVLHVRRGGVRRQTRNKCRLVLIRGKEEAEHKWGRACWQTNCMKYQYSYVRSHARVPLPVSCSLHTPRPRAPTTKHARVAAISLQHAASINLFALTARPYFCWWGCCFVLPPPTTTTNTHSVEHLPSPHSF
jgi:hypothetical protein